MDKFSQICKDIKDIKIQGAVNVARKGLEAYSLKPGKESIKKLLSLRPTEPMLRNVLEYAERFSAEDAFKIINKHFDKMLLYGKKFIKTNNIIKLEKKIKLIYRKLTNIRDNHIHQSTSKIIKLNPYRVVMEDLNIKGMMKNKNLSKAIQEQKLYEFIRQMKYKCNFNCIEFVQVDRFYPSSKLCSDCGFKKKDLKLSDRIYKCDNCGLVIDRDKNASINLGNYKLA